MQEAGDASRWQHESGQEPVGNGVTEGGQKDRAGAASWKLKAESRTKRVRELKKRGHDVRFDVGGYGGYQAIKVEMHDGQRVYVGASESRKDGQAAGY